MKRVFVYPGSFDPVTLGHMDIIERASVQCDELIVAVLVNNNKSTIFTIDERVELINMSVAHMNNVKVQHFNGLLADYMKMNGYKTLIKGLRAVTDFDYELQMALLNKRLNADIETLLMIASQEHLFLSSSVVRDLARNHADLRGYIPDVILDKVAEKYRQ